MSSNAYEREVYGAGDSSSGSWGDSARFGVSAESKREIGQRTSMDISLSPILKIVLRSSTKKPIVIIVDVTGSNLNFAKVIYDKMPMFYEQITQYLDDFDISFCAVGDANVGDRYPIQVADFAQGTELDKWLKLIVTEGGGGDVGEESYEAMAQFLVDKFKCDDDASPIIFFIGDEMCYSSLTAKDADFLGYTEEEVKKKVGTSTKVIFKRLCERANGNVFMLLNKLCGREWRSAYYEHWQRLLPSKHTVKIYEEKSVVDIMLGIISMCHKLRTLEEYIEDMKKRGQTDTRVANIKKSLGGLAKELIPAVVMGEIPESAESVEGTSEGSGSRL